jgi:sulfate adenylyltransferase subunit 2
MPELRDLENKSLYILREAYAEFERLAVLWSTGKDSTATGVRTALLSGTRD